MVHGQWFADTSVKNLDGLMSHTAADIVSYEHEMRLLHVGVDAFREVCDTAVRSAGGTVE